MSHLRIDEITAITMRVMAADRNVLPAPLRHPDVVRGVILASIGYSPIDVYPLNETEFLLSFDSHLTVQEVGEAVEGIALWLGTPIEITCDKVGPDQVEDVMRRARSHNGRDSVTVGREEVLHTPRHGSGARPGAENIPPFRFSPESGSTPLYPAREEPIDGQRAMGNRPRQLLTKANLPKFSGDPSEKGTVAIEAWMHAVADIRRTHTDEAVRTAIAQSCTGAAADALSNLPVGSSVEAIFGKFAWMFGNADSMDALMQEFYQMVQAKSESIALFIIRLEKTMKAIRAKHPGRISEEESDRHLRERLFHGMREEFRMALRYKYDGNLALHYSELAFAAREIENKNKKSSVHHGEARMKSATVADGVEVVTAAGSPFDEIQKQIATLMSAIVNNQKQVSGKQNNGGGKFSKPQKPGQRDWSKSKCFNCGENGHGWRRCSKPVVDSNNLPFSPRNLNGQQGEGAANPPSAGEANHQ